MAVSAWTLVAISCERYYAIVHPLKSRRWQTLSHAYKLIGLIWCGSLLFMSPIAVLSRLIPTSQGKRRNWMEFEPVLLQNQYDVTQPGNNLRLFSGKILTAYLFS